MDCHFFALRLLDWLCFLQQEHRVQQAQGVFAPVQHFNLLHVFFTFMHSYCIPRSLAQTLLVTVHSKVVVGCYTQDRTLKLRSARKYSVSRSCQQHAPEYQLNDNISIRLDVLLELFYIWLLLNDAFSLAERVRKSPPLICKQASLAILMAASHLVRHAAPNASISSHDLSCMFSTWLQQDGVVRHLRLA